MPRITITVPERTPQPYRFHLERPTVTLGRGSENDIAIDCRSISVKHAEMVRVKGGYELRDVGSTNGIKLDGHRQQTIELRNGLAMTLGDVGFEFLLTDEEQQALLREMPGSIKTGETTDEQPSKAGEESPAPVPRKPKPAPVPAPGGGGGLAMVLLFLILAAAAFFAGMAIRYQKDTGSSLLDAIRNRSKIVAPAAKETRAPLTPADPQ
jgi:FHA domain